MGEELEMSMKATKELNDKYQAATKALDYLYESGINSYTVGYNKAIEDVLDYLCNCAHHIEGWTEILGTLKGLEK